MKKGWFIIVLVGLFCLTITETGISADPIVLKFGDATAKTFSYWPANQAMKKIVEEKTRGNVEIKLYMDGVLGDQKTLMESTRMGAVQIFTATSSLLSTLVPEFSIFTLPFIWRDHQTIINFYGSEYGKKYFDKKLQKSGLKLLTMAYVGFTGVQNKQHPTRVPEDFVGLKIRVLQNPVMVDTLNAIGAMGVAMGLGELYSAVQQGVIDGILTTPQLLYSMKIYEVAKYFSDLRMTGSAAMVMMNLDTWNSLPADVQKIFYEASTAWEKANNAYYLDNSNWTSQDNILDAYRKAGVTVTEPDREAFRKITLPVVSKWREKIGPEFVDKVLENVGYKLE